MSGSGTVAMLIRRGQSRIGDLTGKLTVPFYHPGSVDDFADTVEQFMQNSGSANNRERSVQCLES